jgi:hypothetical protein
VQLRVEGTAGIVGEGRRADFARDFRMALKRGISLPGSEALQFRECDPGGLLVGGPQSLPVDEVSDMDDIAQTVEVLGDSVEWVIVRNPVRIPTTKFFQGSELESQLLGFGAVRLEIPALLSDTRNHLRSQEIQLGRGLSPAEALRSPSIQLDIAHRIVLEQWMAEFFERLDAIAGHLIPTTKAKALQPARRREVVAPKRRISGINLESIR